MTTRWYAIQIMPQMQNKVEYHLKNQSFQYFFPRVVTKTNRKKEVLDTAPAFKGYGFVRFNPLSDKWPAINYTKGVIKLLPRWADSPYPMRRGFVENFIKNDPLFEDDLLQCFDEFYPGCEIEARRGLMAGRRGVVIQELGRKLLEISFLSNSATNHAIKLKRVDVVPVG